MKKLIVTLLMATTLIACKKDDDTTMDPEFIEVDLTKEFLLNEKWFINVAVDDDCELDNFYIFDLNNVGSVVIQDGEAVCTDFSDDYGQRTFSYSIDDSSNRLVVETNSFKILGGFANPANSINGVSFMLKRDNSLKLIKGSIAIEVNGTDTTVIPYELIARANDRP